MLFRLANNSDLISCCDIENEIYDASYLLASARRGAAIRINSFRSKHRAPLSKCMLAYRRTNSFETTHLCENENNLSLHQHCQYFLNNVNTLTWTVGRTSSSCSRTFPLRAVLSTYMYNICKARTDASLARTERT